MSTRRDFIKKTASVAAASCCGLGAMNLMQSCTTIQYANYSSSSTQLVVSMASINSSFVLLDTPQLGAPVYLKQTADREYKAMLLLCTHKGCDVKPAGSIFICPCHGSEFSGSGNVITGPAEEPLTQFETHTDEKNIYIKIVKS